MGKASAQGSSYLKAVSSSGKLSSVFGWIIVIFFGLAFLAGLASKDDGSGSKTSALLFLALCIAGGVLLILRGKKVKKQIQRFQSYINLILSQNKTSLQDISNFVHIPSATVTSELQLLISKGLLPGVFVNFKMQRVEFLTKNVGATYAAPAGSAVSQKALKAVVCKNCGANNEIAEGSTENCEYCGSPINA